MPTLKDNADLEMMSETEWPDCRSQLLEHSVQGHCARGERRGMGKALKLKQATILSHPISTRCKGKVSPHIWSHETLTAPEGTEPVASAMASLVPNCSQLHQS